MCVATCVCECECTCERKSARKEDVSVRDKKQKEKEKERERKREREGEKSKNVGHYARMKEQKCGCLDVCACMSLQVCVCMCTSVCFVRKRDRELKVVRQKIGLQNTLREEKDKKQRKLNQKIAGGRQRLKKERKNKLFR